MVLIPTPQGNVSVPAATRGAIIYGDNTPKWDRLPLGANGYVLHSDGADIAWAQLASNELSDAANILLADGSVPLTAPWAANNDITGLTKLVVDNIQLDGNTISAISGALFITSGTGVVLIGSSSNDVIISGTFSKIQLVSPNIELKNLGGGGDVLVSFNGIVNDGTLTYMTSEDEFRFSSLVQATQLKSTIVTGTAPLVIASTDVVANLNADLLDDLQGAAYSLIDGTRAFTGVVAGIDPTASIHLATKEYVDRAIHFIEGYFLTDVVSDIGGIYFVMQERSTGAGLSTFFTGPLATGDDQALINWATLAGVPGVITFEEGVYASHIHAAVTAGNKPVQLYFEIWTRLADSPFTETLRATSEISGLVTSETEVELHATLAADININATDRYIVKWLANVGATGSNVTIEIYAEDTTASRISVPIATEVLSSIFIRQDGTTSLVGPWAANNDITGLTKLEVDNVRIDGGTIEHTLGTLLIQAGGITGGIILKTAGTAPVVIRSLLLQVEDDLRVDGVAAIIGSLGIGLTIPQKNLHISSTVPTIRLSDSNAATDQEVATLIELYRGDATSRVGYWGMETWTNDVMVLATDYPAGEIRLSTGSAVTAVLIDSSQNFNFQAGNLTTTGNIIVGGTVGRFGLGIATPQSLAHLLQTGDAADDATFANWGLLVSNILNTNGLEVGIGFRISSNQLSTQVPGAAITHERIGAGSRGKLHLKTSVDGTSLTTRFTIDENGNIGVGQVSPATSAILELSSTTGAFLNVRMTTTQRDALTAVDGMMMYNKTTSEMNYRKAGAWVAI